MRFNVRTYCNDAYSTIKICTRIAYLFEEFGEAEEKHRQDEESWRKHCLVAEPKAKHDGAVR